MADLLPNRATLTAGVVMAATAYASSFLINRAGSQVASLPGFKFIANIESQGVMESSLGLILLEILTQMIARRLL